MIGRPDDDAAGAVHDGAGLAGGDRLPGLDRAQQRRVREWLPGAHLVADLGWGLVDSTVLHVRTSDGAAGQARDLVVKAGGPGNHHIHRELRAYDGWVGPLQARGAVPVLRHGDTEARVFVTDFLPGDLLHGHPDETDPDVYRQAGALLALLHGQARRVDADLGIAFNLERRERALRWLAGEHRIPPETVRELRALLADHPTAPAVLVPTHGDYHPRNWMIHRGRVVVIDFGRFDWRPPQTDLARLAAQQFRDDPALEAAFIDGYGCDPRGEDEWRQVMLTEAIGTAVWAYLVGDEQFEAQGHRMIDDALTLFG